MQIFNIFLEKITVTTSSFNPWKSVIGIPILIFLFEILFQLSSSEYLKIMDGENDFKKLDVKILDDNLKHLGKVIKQTLKKDIISLKGAGAAGGLGAGLVAFARARMESGVEIVIEASNIRKHLKNADLAITGEGRVDSQTAFGKTPSGVAKVARKYRVPTIVIGGGITDDASDIFSFGIDGLESACARDMSLDEAIKNSRKHLENAAERAIRLVLIGRKITKKKRK